MYSTSDTLRIGFIFLLTTLVLGVWAQRHIMPPTPPQPETAHYCANTQGAYTHQGTLWVYGYDFAPCKWLNIEQDI